MILQTIVKPHRTTYIMRSTVLVPYCMVYSEVNEIRIRRPSGKSKFPIKNLGVTHRKDMCPAVKYVHGHIKQTLRYTILFVFTLHCIISEVCNKQLPLLTVKDKYKLSQPPDRCRTYYKLQVVYLKKKSIYKNLFTLFESRLHACSWYSIRLHTYDWCHFSSHFLI